MKKILLASLVLASATSAMAWDQTGYYYPEQEPDSIWQEWKEFATGDLEWSGLNAGFFDYDMVIKKRISKDPANHKFQFSLGKYFAPGTDLIVEYNPDNGEFRIPITRKGVNNMWDGEPLLSTDYKTFYGAADPYSSWDEENGVLKIFVMDYYPNQDMGDGTFGDRAYAYGTHILRMHGFTKYDIEIDAPECSSVYNLKATLKMTSHPKDVCYELINDLVLPYDTATFVRVDKDKKHPLTATPEIEFALKEGVNSIVCTSRDNEGRLIHSVKNIYCMADDADNWKTLGKGTFTEDAVLGLGGEGWKPTEIEVEVQEHKANSGLYRIKNPYQALPQKYSEIKYEHAEHNHYLYFNASNPNIVVFGAQNTGIIPSENFGSAYLTSKAYEMKRAGKLQPEYVPYCGKLKDGKISFPEGSIGIRLPEYTKVTGADLVYWVNNNGRFELKLPESGITDIEAADENMPAEYFSLQGRRIAEPAAGEVVIVRRGSKVSKEIFRK